RAWVGRVSGRAAECCRKIESRAQGAGCGGWRKSSGGWSSAYRSGPDPTLHYSITPSLRPRRQLRTPSFLRGGGDFGGAVAEGAAFDQVVDVFHVADAVEAEAAAV